MLAVNITWVINLSSTGLILPFLLFSYLYNFLKIISLFPVSSSYCLSRFFPVSSSRFSLFNFQLFFHWILLLLCIFLQLFPLLDIPGCYFILTWSQNSLTLYSLCCLLPRSVSPLSDTGWSGAEGEGSWDRDKCETEFPHWSRRGCQELEGTLMKNLAAFISSRCATQLASLKMMEHMKTLCEINQHSQDLRSLRSSDSSHVISMVRC